MIHILLAALSSFALADQLDPIVKARDHHVSQAQALLEKACPGAPHYLCRLQLESDCKKNTEEACKNLKALKALEEKAIGTDQTINSFVKVPFYKESAPVKKTKMTDLKLGSPKPSKSNISEKFKLGDVEQDYKNLLDTRAKIQTQEIQIQCDRLEDCKAQPVGHKICGGPQAYLIMSNKDPNYGKISAEINLMNYMDASLQRKLSVMGTCDYNSEPTLACEKGVCSRK
jgi:hypothetical protein